VLPLSPPAPAIKALLTLFERDGRTQRELCEVASVDQSTMAKTLARMRRDGLVREEPEMAGKLEAPLP
jgi:DNA-binding MarR family transcriptional regulator